jgi:branched-chain amino acid transport system permease protein
MTDFLAAYSNVIDLCLLNALLALGCFLLLGANLFSLGTGGLMAIGAYLSVWLTMQAGWGFAPALLAGTLAAALAAAGLGALVLRLRGDYFAMATLAFTEVVRVIAFNWDSLTGGALGIFGIPQLTEAWHIGLALVAVTYAVWAIRRSPLGRRIQALSADELAVTASGHDIARLKLALFTAAGAVAGLGGGLAAHLNTFISPGDFGFVRSVDAVVAAVFGGAWNLAGPWIGATILTVLPEALRFSAQMREVLVGICVLAVVLFLPGGVASFGDFRFFRRARRSS